MWYKDYFNEKRVLIEDNIPYHLTVRELAKEAPLETRWLESTHIIRIYICYNNRGVRQDIKFLESLKSHISKANLKYLQEEIDHIKKYRITRIDYIEGIVFDTEEVYKRVRKHFGITSVKGRGRKKKDE